MIGCPTEIFVRDPCPSVIGVGPIAIGIGTPIGIIHSHIGLPAVAVAFNVDPVPAGKIIVKEIDRDLLSLHLRESRQDKSKHG